MEERLIKKFETEFKPVDKKVKEEELLIFLDKQTPAKFDRDTFNDLKSRVQDQDLETTPLNFARTYYQAYELLEVKRQRTALDLDHLDRMTQTLKQERNNQIFKVEFSRVRVENPSDSSNYFTFEYSPDFAINLYNFTDEDSQFLIIPINEGEDKITIRITLNTPHGKTLDTKNVSLSGSEAPEQTRAKFNDGSILTFFSSKRLTNQEDWQLELGDLKSDRQDYANFVKAKREYLAKTFPDIFLPTFGWENKKVNCGFWLTITCVVSFVVGIIAFYLNFTRCMFIDLFAIMSFFSKMYIWRSFNLFLALKLITVLFVSVILDLAWEIHKLISFNAHYEETVKAERKKGFVLVAILVVSKICLMFFYYKLSRENQTDGFLGIDSEISINEVHDDDYIIKTGLNKVNILI